MAWSDELEMIRIRHGSDHQTPAVLIRSRLHGAVTPEGCHHAGRMAKDHDSFQVQRIAFSQHAQMVYGCPDIEERSGPAGTIMPKPPIGHISGYNAIPNQTPRQQALTNPLQSG